MWCLIFLLVCTSMMMQYKPRLDKPNFTLTQLAHTCSKSARWKIWSKLTIKTLERCQWRHSGVFIVNFQQTSHLVLVFSLLILNKQVLNRNVHGNSSIFVSQGLYSWGSIDEISFIVCLASVYNFYEIAMYNLEK